MEYMTSAEYVGTNLDSGRMQLKFLIEEGCTPEHKVLDVGCGCLHAGVHLLRYLNKGNYNVIEPNTWLIEDACKNTEVRELINERGMNIVSNDSFDCREFGCLFNFILAHSILSHCAHYQLDLFFKNLSLALPPDGKILASIRLAEGNDYGSYGHPNKQDSSCTEWQYPHVSYFRNETVVRQAHKYGLLAILNPLRTKHMIQVRPLEYHDWFVFVKP